MAAFGKKLKECRESKGFLQNDWLRPLKCIIPSLASMNGMKHTLYAIDGLIKYAKLKTL